MIMSNLHENNSIRGPINSWFFDTISDYMDRLFGSSKRKLFRDHPSTVVEVGPGAGANMRYLRRGTKLIAIEPNIYMHANLTKNASRYGIDLEIRALVGEEIDLPTNSCDFVVSTLVLCTVIDPLGCIGQIRRILKPSGVFVFLEHVCARENSLLALLQKLVHRPWHWFFEGCHTNRDIKSFLLQGGFSSLHIEEYSLYSPFVPITPQIKGRAIK